MPAAQRTAGLAYVPVDAAATVAAVVTRARLAVWRFTFVPQGEVVPGYTDVCCASVDEHIGHTRLHGGSSRSSDGLAAPRPSAPRTARPLHAARARVTHSLTRTIVRPMRDGLRLSRVRRYAVSLRRRAA